MNATELAEYSDAELVKLVPGFENCYAQVNGIELHYVIGGKGEPLVLLPGWPETWWSFHKIMPALAEKYQVIVVDIRGMGGSARPADGYDKKNMASDIFELTKQLGFERIYLAGHDVGSMVAYSFACNYPESLFKLVMIDAVHPDKSYHSIPLLPSPGTFGDGTKVNPAAPYLWWFAFHQVKFLPERILLGRFRMEQDWFFNYLLPDESHIGPFDRVVYEIAYDTSDGIRAGNAWYQSFEQDIIDDQSYEKIVLPVLGIGGVSFGLLNAIMPSKATDLKLVQMDCGHFPAEEKPEETTRLILDFLKQPEIGIYHLKK